MRIYSMKKATTKPPRGGSREGSGRPSLGKIRVNLTLNEALVEQARHRENNLSALLDRLLEQWLQNKKS
ncbi:MAG: type II toxin-antitoxin system CcdA family antitoxin [Prosthecobacter sp.]|nr:type II toxin-antitoxin system CcdA family antitoxin [Prosthecobacter sp.]